MLPDAESFEPDEPIKKAAVHDKWEGEDEEDDVKVSNGRHVCCLHNNKCVWCLNNETRFHCH